MRRLRNFFWKIENEVNLLKRCCRYARRLNKIDKILNKYFQKKNLSSDTLNLLDEIDRILDE